MISSLGGLGGPHGLYHRRALSNRWAPLALVVCAGAVAHLVLASIADPAQFDTHSFLIMADAFRDDPLQAYDTERFPYPPGFLPWLLVADSGAAQEVIPFDVLLRLPMIAADVAIALLVASFLARRGALERTRLVAVALVMLGPIFLAISGYHGQIDSVAILPAVAALWLWDRHGSDSALLIGVLIGLGAAVKTVPIFLLLALVPAARAWGDVLRLIVPAVAIPILLFAPFLLANGPDTVEAMGGNRGYAGFNAVSLILVEPGLVEFWNWLGVDSVVWTKRLTEVQPLIVGSTLLAVGALLFVRRVPPVLGASLIWLALFTVNPNFAWHYLIWGMPFFIMAGYLREVLVFQLVASVPLVLFYLPGDLSRPVLDFAYTPTALVCWFALVGALLLLLRRIWRMPADRPRFLVRSTSTA